MPSPSKPMLEPGRVYRTRHFVNRTKDPAGLVRKLVREGHLIRLARGLYWHPKQSRFGPVPPDDHELMRVFLKDTRFLMTGPEIWNPLNLGATALFAARLVYNTKRSGEFVLGGRRFILRRVSFPEFPTPEWAVVDLIEHHEAAGVSHEHLERHLTRALASGRFRLDALVKAGRKYGTRATQRLIERAAGRAA